MSGRVGAAARFGHLGRCSPLMISLAGKACCFANNCALFSGPYHCALGAGVKGTLENDF
jgi:hypothetical protein